MEFSDVYRRLKYSLRKNEVQMLANFFSNDTDALEKLFDISLTTDDAQAFHASWVLENCLLTQPDRLNSFAPKLLDIIPKLKSSSVKRHFCKMLKVWMIAHRNEMDRWVKANAQGVELLIESCYTWVLESGTPVGVKVHCFEILALLATHVDWLRSEMPNIMRLIRLGATPGERAMVNRISVKWKL